jgi:hypothetical protein
MPRPNRPSSLASSAPRVASDEAHWTFPFEAFGADELAKSQPVWPCPFEAFIAYKPTFAMMLYASLPTPLAEGPPSYPRAFAQKLWHARDLQL